MDQLYDKFMGKLKHEAVKLKREAKRIAELETPLEKSLREATSNQNWGCPNSVLYELAVSCGSYSDRQKILKHCWERMESKEDKWRRVLKTLTLLDYLVKHGPDQVVSDLQGEQAMFRKLLSFKCSEDGHDRGAAIRDKARAILDILGDREKLREEREKAKEQQNRMRGTSNMPSGDIGNSGGGGGGGSSSGAATRELAAAAGQLFDAAKSAATGETGGGISRAKFEERFNELKQKRDREKEQETAKKGSFSGADSLRVADESGADGGRRNRRQDDDFDDRPARRGIDDFDDRPARRERDRSDDRRDDRRDSRSRGKPGRDKQDSDSDDGPRERPADAPPMSDLLDMCDGPAPAPVASRSPAAAPASPIGLLPPPGAKPGGLLPPPGGIPPPGAIAPPSPLGAVAPSSGGFDDLLGGGSPAPAAPSAPPAAGPAEDLFGDSSFQGAAPAAAAGSAMFSSPAPAPQEDMFGGFQASSGLGRPAAMPSAPQPQQWAGGAPAAFGSPAAASPPQDMFGGFQAMAAAPAPMMGTQAAPAFYGAPAAAPAPAWSPPAVGGMAGAPPTAASPPAAQSPGTNEDLMAKSLRELNLSADVPSAPKASAPAKGPGNVDVGDAFELALGR